MRFIFLLLGALWSVSVGANELTSLRHLGNENAPVQMYLFSSYACPHCADFHQNILPKIQKKYLDTQMAYFTFVDISGDENSLMPVLLMRCAKAFKQSELAKQFYHQQKQWAQEKNPRKKLLKMAQSVGMTPQEFNQCLSNSSLKNQVIEQQNNLSQIYDVDRLPTLVVRQGNRVEKLEGADDKLVMEGLCDFWE